MSAVAGAECSILPVLVGVAIGLLLAAAILGVLFALCRRPRRNAVLLEENRRLELLLQIQQQQYSALGARIDDLRELRHDLRHYIVTLEASCQEDGWLAGLLRTAQAVRDKLKVGTDGPLGDVSVMGAVVRHYQSVAATRGVQTDFRLDVGEHGWGANLCLLLSNLMENALEAVAREPGGAGLIRLRATHTRGWLAIVVGNTFTGTLDEGSGKRHSSKQWARLGIGLKSVRRIAEKCGGKVCLSADGSYFKASVFLPKPGTESGTGASDAEEQNGSKPMALS